MSLFSGVFVANATPFDAKGKLDLVAYDNHLQFLVDKGVHGFVPCGTTGEGALITHEERNEIISRTVKVAKAKGLKTIPGCGTNNTAATLELIRTAREMGCDAALVVTPYYVKPTPGGITAHYLHLAERGDLPILLYNVPSRTGLHLSVDIVMKLLEHPRIVGIKEASGQHGYWLALSRAMNLKEKALLAGDDDALATICALGGSGIISASANVAPAQFVEIYNYAREGNVTEAFAAQKRLSPLVQSLFLETNPAPVKYALKKMGLFENNLRLPLVPVTRATEDAVTAALGAL